ncbi:hypothetical protein AUC60_00785 [Pseudomonas caspiana]|uniref:Uncharacterized protein n=1 Tax=Pseudomonas caspiana TaxID=1451454 RepID=A0A1Y3P745_9PSED|nr:hypothetical protein AUC60_00785 [Pseudomonas caspiana]
MDISAKMTIIKNAKRSRQLKIKKFHFRAKEIRIAADREVSRGDSGIDSHLPRPFMLNPPFAR